MGLFSFLGLSNNNVKHALYNGAAIIDVRTAHEYDRGRIKGSINIPLERLHANIERIKAMKKPLVICCSGDGRSDEARRILKSNGLKEVYKAGNWESLLKLVLQVRG